MQSTARWFAKVQSTEDLLEGIEFARSRQLELFILGGGSNVVLGEKLDALVIQMAIPGRSVESDRVVVSAGENWHQFVRFCLEQGRYGLENLALIPGTVGAAPIQNIGAYGVELANFVDQLTAVNAKTGEKAVFSAEDCNFGYRSSRFQKDQYWVVTELSLALSLLESPILDYPGLRQHLESVEMEPSALNVFKSVCDIRTAKLPDPALTPNAGSFFKNPMVSTEFATRLESTNAGLPVFKAPENAMARKVSAAWLIDKAGLKGHRRGDFQISPQHALVIVNQGKGKLADLLGLVEQVQATIREKYGIELEPEPGFYPARRVS